jgi:hypothetical protein
VQLGKGPHDQPHEHPPPGEIGEQGAAPQFEQLAHACPLGGNGGDRDEESLGEQFAAPEQQSQEADREREAGKEWVSGDVQHRQVREHPHRHFGTAEEARHQDLTPTAMQSLGAFVDHPVEGVFQLVLDGTAGASQIALARPAHGHPHDRAMR